MDFLDIEITRFGNSPEIISGINAYKPSITRVKLKKDTTPALKWGLLWSMSMY